MNYQIMEMVNSGLVIRGANPRRNLPPRFSRKRTESNFLCAFERAYRTSVNPGGIVGRDLEVSGYGIADWVWIGWRRRATGEDATAYSLEKLPPSLRIHAFELKISDWRRALSQAFRYSYFADRAIVVIPPQALRLARVHLDLFKRLRIGLWGFDSDSGRIRRVYTPRILKARNEKAKARAVQLILRRIKFSQLRKKL
ncbi:MAG: hypothetical protein KIT44_00265 [Opitutaceae bacterium]|nr:hypothetical protein [Opitutaceae bacterium]